MYYGISFASVPHCNHLIRTRQHKGWSHKGGINAYIGIVFALEGSATFCVEGTVHHLTVGDWLFMLPGSFYQANTEDYFEFYSLTFSVPLELTDSLPPSRFVPPSCSSTELPTITSDVIYLADKIEAFDCMPELLRILNEMQRLLFHPSVAERLMFDLYFGQLLLILSTKVTGDQSTAAPSLLVQTIDYIHAHFQQPLSLEGLSEQLHVSKSYLARLFRQHTRMTVTNYINNIKLDYAAQMLRFNSKSIREISEYIGYQDAAYFSRIFRKRFGMSPLKFRLMPKSVSDTPKSKQTE